MNLISRYIISEIAKYFCLSLLSVLCIFIAIDYMGGMDNFIEAEISLWRALQYVVLRVPYIVTQAMPVILLLTILITFGLMSKNNELMVLNSSGISIFALVKPVLMVAAAAALLLFYLNEHLVPVTMQQANAIRNREIRKLSIASYKDQDIWFKSHRTITHIKYYDPAKATMSGFSRYRFDADYRLVQRLDAQRGVFGDGHWILHDCMNQVLDKTIDTYHITLHGTLEQDLQLYPDDFKQIVRKSEELNFQELMAFVRKVEQEGYDATAYKVDLNVKIAYPFVCIIMAVVAIGFTARIKLKGGLPVSISYGLGIGFLYYVFHSFCVSLGYGGILPPVIAAWIANFVFFCFGVILLLNAE